MLRYLKVPVYSNTHFCSDADNLLGYIKHIKSQRVAWHSAAALYHLPRQQLKRRTATVNV